MSDDLKRAAAAAALDEIRDGMRLGLGTGSTADHFVRLLAERVAGGLNVVGVPTSEKTAALATELNIPLSTLDLLPELDLTVDGADELDRDLCLIKGGGGALLREKIVAAASARMIVIADGSKLVETVGGFPLPIEVVPFGLESTRRAIVAKATVLGLDGDVKLRGGASTPFITDGGHYILDASFRQIDRPEALSNALSSIPGVVEHGLFIDLAAAAYVARSDGVERLEH